MRFCCSSLVVLLLATGCASRGATTPVTAPAPETIAVATTSRTVVPADTAPRESAGGPVVSDSEVVTRAAAIFEGVPAPVASSGPMVADARATWDIDVRSYETHEMVAQYVDIFTGRAREYMERSVSRGTRYDAMLRRKFRESGLPEDMTYLALIESSYLPHAYSRAAAVGMWQFMAPTARGIGMRVDWWVDERRDPMRATEGAIDFLTDLHDAYGSWYLAAAAYNGGPGRVSRGLKRFSEAMDGAEGEDRFFALAEQKYLPSETKAYVPKLIAAAMVAKEPARYGLRVDTMPEFAYDSVDVVGGTPLAAVAKAAGVSLEDVQELNPHFLRGVTPPDEVTEVRVPVGKAEGFNAAFNALPETERLGWRTERVARLRSAQSIADEAGIPVRAIRWLNPKISYDRRGRIRAGTVIRIPTALTVAGARDVPDPSIARYGSSSGALAAKRVRVRSGETLASVARRSGVSVASLRAMNGIKGNRIRAGELLVVRRPSRSAVASARRTAAARARSGASASGKGCTSRVVRVKGKRRTVSSCAAAPAARARSAARSGPAPGKAAVRSTTRRATPAKKKAESTSRR
ncbi:MAG: transglycosylase SLT domain-containing protein [Gemmatimonadaceae bacterium]|nr:transglycosylase SLT domain-containing protein [Gemmatimonadaceae bacterium]